MFRSRMVKVIAGIATLPLTGAVLAAPFTFNKVVDTSGGYSSLSLPAINSSGTVAFSATVSGMQKVLTATPEGAVVTAFDPSTVAGLDGTSAIGAPSLNDAGQIAFALNKLSGGSPSTSVSAVYRLEPGGGSTQISYITNQPLGYDQVAIAPDGKTYWTTRGITPSSVLVSDGTTLYSVGKTSALTRPAVAANGTVGSAVSYDAGGNVSFAIYDVEVNGASLGNTFVNPGAPPPLVTLINISSPDVDSSGNIYFAAARSLLPNALSLYEIPAHGNLAFVGGSAVVGGTSAGAPAINDRGTIVDLWGTKLVEGTGLLDTTIISVGDPLDGSTVTALSFAHDGLSEGNQVAFLATLADGRQGIYTVTVPEPSAAAMALLALFPAVARRPRLGRTTA